MVNAKPNAQTKEEEIKERGEKFMGEYRVLSQKWKMDMRAVITRNGPMIEIFDTTEQPKDDL